jgi:dihydroorotase-like cyclic amidohydrolase
VDVEDKSEVEIEGIEEVGSVSIIERELETIIASLHAPQWRERERERIGKMKKGFIIELLMPKVLQLQNTKKFVSIS